VLKSSASAASSGSDGPADELSSGARAPVAKRVHRVGYGEAQVEIRHLQAPIGYQVPRAPTESKPFASSARTSPPYVNLSLICSPAFRALGNATATKSSPRRASCEPSMAGL